MQTQRNNFPMFQLRYCLLLIISLFLALRKITADVLVNLLKRAYDALQIIDLTLLGQVLKKKYLNFLFF